VRRTAAAALVAMLLPALPAAAAESSLTVEDVATSEHPRLVISIRVSGSLTETPLVGESFSLFENGVRVSAGVWTFDAEPLEVALVMDTSGSMDGDPMVDARRAAAAFLDRLPEAADVAVVSFGGEAAVVHAFGGEIPQATAAIEDLQAEGETALYDAILEAVGAFPVHSGARRVMVILSDGGDTVSSVTLDEAAAAITETGAEVHVVALRTDETDQTSLDRLAEAGAGTVIAVDDAELLSDAYADVASELAGRYRLVYRTEAAGPVRLTVSVSHHGDVAWDAVDLSLPVAEGPGPLWRTPDSPTAAAEHSTGSPVEMEHPGLLRRAWTFPAGLAAVLGGVMAVVGLTLVGRRRTDSIDPAVRRRSGGKILSFLSRRAESAADALIPVESTGSLDRALDRAGVGLRPGEFVVLAASLVVVAVAVGILAMGPVGGFLLGTVALVAPHVLLRSLTQRRRAAFADQFEGALQMISGSLRAGYGLLQAVATVASEAPSPTGDEFGRVTVENQLGRSVEEALAAMADRMENEDLRWVVEAINIQYEVGGDLAEVLDSVAETIRDRNQIRRQVKALSAEGRISAIILVSLPFALAALLSVVSPEYLAELTGSGVGRIMILVALLLIGAGTAWIAKIVRVVF
jgi:tight adherence protein B